MPPADDIAALPTSVGDGDPDRNAHHDVVRAPLDLGFYVIKEAS
ncbi:hypothetical protein QNA23_11205 [Rhodococcus erythropolis]|nr:hypothetical protein [Rhodococcus erythropolis]MDJ0404050.1 hypothetical protein [Rhodococcus erythropolis]